MNLADQARNFRCRRRIVAEIGRHDARGQINEILAGGIGHGLNLLKIVIPQEILHAKILHVRQQLAARLRFRCLARPVEYERITLTVTRTTVFYFSKTPPSPQGLWSRCMRSSSIDAKRSMPSGICASIEPSEYNE